MNNLVPKAYGDAREAARNRVIFIDFWDLLQFTVKYCW